MSVHTRLKNILIPSAILLILLFIPYVVKSSQWLEGYSFRKEISINNTNGSALTNYQVELTLHEGSGSGSGANIYLDGNAQSDFGDIRFT